MGRETTRPRGVGQQLRAREDWLFHVQGMFGDRGATREDRWVTRLIPSQGDSQALRIGQTERYGKQARVGAARAEG